MSGKLGVLCGVLLLGGCAEPSYVSLGRNVQSVASATDAGGEASSVAPSALGCEGETAGALPDDPSTPGSDMSFGCELAPPPPPEQPQCQLQGESVAIDSPCQQRLGVTCPESINAVDRTSGLLFDVLARCTELEHRLTVTFLDGCATAFSLEVLQLPEGSGVSDCIAARLSAERYDCAPTAECAVASTFPIIAR